MKTTLLISTYNRKDALRLVLQSALEQTVLPDEIVIADDGSNDDTRALINDIRANSPVPIVHVWHEDEGFRLTEIRNKGVAVASGDYILQIDGDCMLSRHYVEDHVRVARKGRFVGGRRVMLSKELTSRCLEKGQKVVDWFSIISHKKGLRYLKHALRLPFLSRIYSPILTRKRVSKGNVPIEGFSFSFWKDDFISVGGYDEDMQGWGWEDADLFERMSESGYQPYAIRFGGFVYHLHHENRSSYVDYRKNPNYILMMEHKREGTTHIENGIDKWLKNPPTPLS